jgi:nitroreductase
MKDIIDVIKNRRSVRSYKDKPISKEIINKLLEAAVLAPNAMNRQELKFIIVTNKDYIKKLSSAVISESKKQMPDWKFRNLEDPVYYSAPLLIIILGNKDSNWQMSDAAFAAENMMLYARSLDIGSCFIGFTRMLENNKIIKELEIPDNYKIMAALVFGYTNEWPSMPVRKEADVIKWIE